jgi:hypothetical protein
MTSVRRSKRSAKGSPKGAQAEGTCLTSRMAMPPHQKGKSRIAAAI